MDILNETERIAHGLQSYRDHTALCQYEELPNWVMDIAASVNAGNTALLDGKNYDTWVYGVYNLLINEQKATA